MGIRLSNGVRTARPAGNVDDRVHAAMVGKRLGDGAVEAGDVVVLGNICWAGNSPRFRGEDRQSLGTAGDRHNVPATGPQRADGSCADARAGTCNYCILGIYFSHESNVASRGVAQEFWFRKSSSTAA